MELDLHPAPPSHRVTENFATKAGVIHAVGQAGSDAKKTVSGIATDFLQRWNPNLAGERLHALQGPEEVPRGLPESTYRCCHHRTTPTQLPGAMLAVKGSSPLVRPRTGEIQELIRKGSGRATAISHLPGSQERECSYDEKREAEGPSVPPSSMMLGVTQPSLVMLGTKRRGSRPPE